MKAAKLGDTIKHSPTGFQGEVTKTVEGLGPTQITVKSPSGEEKNFKLDGLEIVEAAPT